MDLEKRIILALDTIRPFLQSDGGDVELDSIVDNKIVKIKFTGECENCPMRLTTFKAGIEDTIKKAVPEIETVIALNDE